MAAGKTHHFIRIHRHRRNPVNSAPPDWWWIVIAGISALTDFINPVFTKLQAPNLLLSTQSALLDMLSTEICTIIGIRGPFTVEELRHVAGEFSVICGRWYVDYAETVQFIEGLGTHSRHTLQTLDDELHHKVLYSIEFLATKIVEGIINIQAERNEQNHADSDLPDILPHELIKLSTGDFGKNTVDVHLQQL